MKYIIIGADKQEYGPVEIEELRQWIVQRRVDGNTFLKAEGTSEWKPLSSFPELTVFLNAPPISQIGLPEQDMTADRMTQALEGNYDIDFGSCMSRAWTLLQNNLLTLVVGTLIYIIIVGFGAGVGAIVGLNETRGLYGIQPLRLTVQIVWNFLIGGACVAGYKYLVLRIIRKESTGLSDLFAGFTTAYVQLALVYVVSSILTAIGFVFCLLPGIFLSVCWSFTLLLVLDRKLSFWEAMEVSRKVVMKHWWSVFALVLLVGFIVLAGIFLCCVGVLITMPFAVCIMTYAYQDIFGSPQRTTS